MRPSLKATLDQMRKCDFGLISTHRAVLGDRENASLTGQLERRLHDEGLMHIRITVEGVLERHSSKRISYFFTSHLVSPRRTKRTENRLLFFTSLQGLALRYEQPYFVEGWAGASAKLVCQNGGRQMAFDIADYAQYFALAGGEGFSLKTTYLWQNPLFN